MRKVPTFSEEQPELTDGVVLLTALVDADVPAIVACDNDPETAHWFGWRVGASSVENAQQHVQRCTQRWMRGMRATWAVRDPKSHLYIGYVELNLCGQRRAKVSYAIAPEARGRGLAARAIDLACRFAFAELGRDRIQLMADAANHASIRVAKKAGFSREGVLRGYALRGGERRDQVLFSRLVGDRAPAFVSKA